MNEENKERRLSHEEKKQEEKVITQNLAMKILFSNAKEIEMLKKRPTRDSMKEDASARDSIQSNTTVESSEKGIGRKMLGGLLSGAQSMLQKAGDQAIGFKQSSPTPQKKEPI